MAKQWASDSALTSFHPSPAVLATVLVKALDLFFLTLLVWILSQLSHTEDNKPSQTAMWIAILGSATVFGLGHLPGTLATAQFSLIVLAREILLNGIFGTIFGYLYWKRGLESSMIAHFSSDLLVHAICRFF